MEVNKLNVDELHYECQIRGIVGIDDENELRTVLRGLIKVNPGYELPISLDSNLEVTNCTKKLQELKRFIDNIEGSRFDESYRIADTKLSHLLGRIDRISRKDENIQKKRSVLLKTVLYLMKEMENKVVAHKCSSTTQVSIAHSGASVTMKQNMSSSPEVHAVANSDDVGMEIFTHQGVALKNLKSDRSIDSLPTGTLTIVQYKSGKCIEWKQTDLVFESENTDSEWNLIDTVRKRTCSTSSNNDPTQWQPSLRLTMSELKSYKIKRRGRQISLMCRDGNRYSFLFQCGSGDSFINALRASLNTRRAAHSKNMYLIINEREESRSLNKSFNELNLFPDQNQTYVWNFVRNLHNRPYETTMQTFSKLTDAFLYRPPEHRPLDEEVAELLNKSFHLENNDTTLESDYTIVEEFPNFLSPIRKQSKRGEPLTKEQWENAFDENGRIKDVDSIKSIIFKGGIDLSVRNEVWRYLLGFYPWNFSKEECSKLHLEKKEKYTILKKQWESISADQEERFSAFRDRKSLIEKDVNRTDRTLDYYAGDDNPNLQTLYSILMTYVMYNFDLGYVQGMSDLLSPLLYFINEEITAFWCFVGFMSRVYRNFDLDQAGMKQQLSELFSLLRIICPDLAFYLEKHESGNMFFCFRWLLVLFKREFSYSDIMTLWEVLWTDLPCKNFHLIICVAILDTHKVQLMESGNGFTEILKYVNELSLKMDMREILMTAESIYEQLIEVNEKLPMNVRRILGFAVSTQDEDSENSEEETSSLAVIDEGQCSSGAAESKRKESNKLTALPGRIEACTSNEVNDPKEYTNEIGFEGIERSLSLNYY